MRLTKRERVVLWSMRHRYGFKKAAAEAAQAVGEFTQGITGTLKSGSRASLYRALAGVEALKSTFQQMHNYNHTLAVFAAKAFLVGEFPELPWEEIDFARGANVRGRDIRVDRPPVRIIGEVKTGIRKQDIERDLRKLASLDYRDFTRYMFVTSELAYTCLLDYQRYEFPQICCVWLSRIPRVSRPLAEEERLPKFAPDLGESDVPVEELEVSVRVYHRLKDANIRTVGELARMTDSELVMRTKFGRNSLDQVMRALDRVRRAAPIRAVAERAVGAK